MVEQGFKDALWVGNAAAMEWMERGQANDAVRVLEDVVKFGKSHVGHGRGRGGMILLTLNHLICYLLGE